VASTASTVWAGHGEYGSLQSYPSAPVYFGQLLSSVIGKISYKLGSEGYRGVQVPAFGKVEGDALSHQTGWENDCC
jgi:hypothetical protein